MKSKFTIELARKEIKALQDYVFLVENYKVDSEEQLIIKLYAYTGSIQKVTSKVNEMRIEKNSPLIDSIYITEFIKSRPIDQLHRIVRKNYMTKVARPRKFK